MVPSRITIVHCWSAPRSRSTASLYSFEARGSSTVALDEPLYREWLVAKEGGTGVQRPYLNDMLTGISEEPGVAADCWQREQDTFLKRLELAVVKLGGGDAGGGGGGVVFCKHMAKQNIVYDFTSEIDLPNTVHRHVLMIRDPVAVLSSWKQSGDVHGHAPSTDELGILPMMATYAQVCEHNAHAPVILDSDDLVANPAGALSTLCADLEIDYTDDTC